MPTERCERCNGLGRVIEMVAVLKNMPLEFNCPDCNGTGEVKDAD